MSSDIAELQRKMNWPTVTLEPYAPPQHAIPVDLRNGGRFPSLGLTGPPPTSCREYPVFIGLAPYMGGLVPCKVVNSTCAKIGHTYKEYQIDGPFFVVPLNPLMMEWVHTSHGKIPHGRRPVEAGFEHTGEALYHAVGLVDGVRVPGKAGEHLIKGAHLPYMGEERICPYYLILCWRN
ncbi:hypothetical protein BKA62DRAFT_698263 [Auriculariales sp. MPI-PUGE-AT-0066]|nr:hypothetical protein BKA62DRAFT_698263 [Auriculariales sp. MPI-PUGE-AT-0066]